MSGGIGNCEEVSEERIQDLFPFLKLPAEIRNEIYRLVLLTQNVATDEPNAYHPFRFPGEGSVGARSGPLVTGPLVRVAPGTIRCESWRTYTMGYQMAILLTNWQIYREAWGIFHLENNWTIIRVNKAGFGKDMKDHGFPVVIADNLRHHVRFPVMEVTVIFPTLKHQNQSEDLLVATIHLKQLIRALWTAKGALEMELTIRLQPPRTKNSPGERYLLRPFLKLRGIKRLIILSGSENLYIDELTRAVTFADSVNQSIGELTAGIKRLQRYIKEERWEHAVAQAGKHCILENDCHTVYDLRLVGIERGMNMNTVHARHQIDKEIRMAAAIAIGEVTLYLGQYASTIRFADRGLSCMLSVSAIIFAMQYSAPLFAGSITGLITSVDEAKFQIYLIRARAYISMQRAEDALRDIKTARGFIPSSPTLASVSQAWQVMFGSLPGFAHRSPVAIDLD